MTAGQDRLSTGKAFRAPAEPYPVFGHDCNRFALSRLWWDAAVAHDRVPRCGWRTRSFSINWPRRVGRNLFAGSRSTAIHPPLLYVLLKPWMGRAARVALLLRLFPVTASVLCLLPGSRCAATELYQPRGIWRSASWLFHPMPYITRSICEMYLPADARGLAVEWRFERYLDRSTTRNLLLLSAANLFLAYRVLRVVRGSLEFVICCGSASEECFRFPVATLPVAIPVCALGLVRRPGAASSRFGAESGPGSHRPVRGL